MKKRARLDVLEIGSRLDARRAGMHWLEEIAPRAEAFLEIDPRRPGAPMLRLAVKYARMAQRAIEYDDARSAANAAMWALQAAWQAEIAEARPIVRVGVRAYRSAEAENARRSTAADAQRASWRRQADDIRARSKRPLTKGAIAKKIDRARWNTIRRYI